MNKKRNSKKNIKKIIDRKHKKNNISYINKSVTYKE